MTARRIFVDIRPVNNAQTFDLETEVVITTSTSVVLRVVGAKDPKDGTQRLLEARAGLMALSDVELAALGTTRKAASEKPVTFPPDGAINSPIKKLLSVPTHPEDAAFADEPALYDEEDYPF